MALRRIRKCMEERGEGKKGKSCGFINLLSQGKKSSLSHVSRCSGSRQEREHNKRRRKKEEVAMWLNQVRTKNQAHREEHLGIETSEEGKKGKGKG